MFYYSGTLTGVENSIMRLCKNVEMLGTHVGNILISTILNGVLSMHETIA
ncbi:MAG: hypothetical protein PVSMB2_37850 [Ktedonobacteraceae bacterium]